MKQCDPRSNCPVAHALDIVGDRWTLIVLRDLFTGKARYSQFLTSPERITTNILADRLERMEAAGLISKKLYQERPKRFEYRLTEKGLDLVPAMQAMARWANKHYPDTMTAPEAFLNARRDGV